MYWYQGAAADRQALTRTHMRIETQTEVPTPHPNTTALTVIVRGPKQVRRALEVLDRCPVIRRLPVDLAEVAMGPPTPDLRPADLGFAADVVLTVLLLHNERSGKVQHSPYDLCGAFQVSASRERLYTQPVVCSGVYVCALAMYDRVCTSVTTGDLGDKMRTRERSLDGKAMEGYHATTRANKAKHCHS